MMKTGFILGASATAFAAAAACSSFESTGAPDGATATTDSGLLPDGAPAPLTGVATANLELTFDTPAMVTHGDTVHVPFTIVRDNFYDGTVIVKVGGLPPTITATTATLDNPAVRGEIVLSIGATSPQGPLADMTIDADGQSGARPHVSMPFASFVRGVPGELDTTFANAGKLNVDNAARGSDIEVDAMGRILLMNDTSLRRFDIDGKSEDPTFHPVTFARTERSERIVRRGSDIFVGRNYVGDNSAAIGGWVTKLSDSGVVDGTYGGSTGSALSAGAEATAFGFGSDGRAVTFSVSSTSGACQNRTISSNGNSVSIPNDFSHPALVRAVTYLNDNSATFAGDNYVGKLQTNNAALDSGFGANGFAVLDASMKLNDIVVDSSGDYVVTGAGSGGVLRLARVKTTGQVDTTFTPDAAPYTVKPESITFEKLLEGPTTGYFAGRLAVDAGQNIVQAGQVDAGGTTKCAIVRYSKNGKVDTAFGNNGVAIPDLAGCVAHRVAIQPSGRIIIGGPVVIRIWN